MPKRNPAWWSMLHFYQGALEEFASDLPILSPADESSTLETIRRSKELLDGDRSPHQLRAAVLMWLFDHVFRFLFLPTMACGALVHLVRNLKDLFR